MLRGQVSEMIERNLARSAPDASFAVSVLAALPAVLSETGKVAGVSTTAVKGSLAAGSTAKWFAFLLPWLGLFGGLAGGVGGSVAALKDDRTQTERSLTKRFLARIWVAVVVLMVGFVTLMHLHIRLKWSDEVFVPAVAGWFALYWAVMSAVVARYQVRSREVRDPNRALPGHADGPTAIFSGLAIAVGTAVGTLAWMIQLASEAGDTLGAAVVVLLIIAVSVLNVFTLGRRPARMIPFCTLAFCAAIPAMLHWRLDHWIVAMRHIDLSTVAAPPHVPIWSVDVIAVALVAWAVLLMLLAPTRATALRSTR
jgi:hypothetical protein